MKRILPYFASAVLLYSCNTVNQAQKNLNSGNYNKAISAAVDRLKKSKQKEKDFAFISILEKAYNTKEAQVQSRIQLLEADHNSSPKELYNLYMDLYNMQEQVRPLLPLKHANGNLVNIILKDYSQEIIQAKTTYVSSLYNSALFMLSGDKQENRKAYSVLSEIASVYPNYRSTNQLLKQAKVKGTDYVDILLENNTKVLIPQDLQDAILDINASSLNTTWTEYHSYPQKGINYDYQIVLEFHTLQISPERIKEELIPVERQIIEQDYRKDRNGKYVLDANGNRIKEERTSVVKATLRQTIQQKVLTLGAQVHYYDLNANRKLKSFPLNTEFVFENVFATYKGDKRALNDQDLRLINNRIVPFPSNEQMLYDASNDIKQRFTSIVKSNSIR